MTDEDRARLCEALGIEPLWCAACGRDHVRPIDSDPALAVKAIGIATGSDSEQSSNFTIWKNSGHFRLSDRGKWGACWNTGSGDFNGHGASFPAAVCTALLAALDAGALGEGP